MTKKSLVGVFIVLGVFVALVAGFVATATISTQAANDAVTSQQASTALHSCLIHHTVTPVCKTMAGTDVATQTVLARSAATMDAQVQQAHVKAERYQNAANILFIVMAILVLGIVIVLKARGASLLHQHDEVPAVP